MRRKIGRNVLETNRVIVSKERKETLKRRW
jgi:hypothetical protein